MRERRNSLGYVLGAAICGVLGIVGSALLTRLLPPRLYAEYGLLVTLSGAAVTLLLLGMDAAYVRFYFTHGQSGRSWLWRCLAPSLVALVPFCLWLLTGERSVQALWGEPLSLGARCTMCGYVVLLLLHRYAQATARMEERAWRYAASSVVEKGLFLLALPLLLCFLQASILLVCLSLLLGLAGALCVHVRHDFTAVPERGAGRIPRREMLAFGLPYMLNNFVLLLVPSMERTLLRQLGSWEALGIYTAAAVFGMPALLVTGVLDSLWNPFWLRHCEDTALFRARLHESGLLVTSTLGVGVGLCVALRRVAVYLLGEQYRAAFVIAPAVLLCAGLGAVALIYGVGINVRKKTWHHLLSALAQLGLSALLCLWLVPAHGAVGAAIAALSGALLGKGWRMLVGLRLYPTGVREGRAVLLLLLMTVASLIATRTDSVLLDVGTGALLVALCVLLSLGEGRAAFARWRGRER